MKIISPLTNYFGNLKFRTKLFISYILLISIPLFILSIKYYGTGIRALSELARQNVYEIVKQDNQIIDAKLSKIEDDSLNMITDQVLFKAIRDSKKNDNYGLMDMDRKLTNVLDKYISEDSSYYSANIVLSYYTFGRNNILIPFENFNKTIIYKKAIESNGGLQWIPTYDFVKTFGNGYLDNVNFDYKYIFSAVRMLNCSYIEKGVCMSLDKSVERPILVVNFKEDLYNDTFENSIPIKGAYYFVMDKSRYIISHSQRNRIASFDRSAWLDKLFEKESGTSLVNIDGKRMIVCFDTSKVTGWVSAIVISPDGLVSNILSVIKSYFYKLLFFLIIVSFFFAYLISGSITKPLNKLLGAIKKTGEGNFDTKIEVDSKGEIGYLIKKFNNMNDKIQHLIDENYMTKIREKETEIMALNMQLNPHFLYNTLNIINWLAIENKQKEISRLLVSLSSMLQYTAQNHGEMENFEDDLRWLKNYIYIMTHRFEGKFTVEYDIDSKLLCCRVPKLFLQPFVENSIIHGFEDIECDGIIKISGRLYEDNMLFTVEDNGKGFPETSEKKKNDKQNIGIKNVDRRVKLIYGDEYGITIESRPNAGTKVIVILPKQS